MITRIEGTLVELDADRVWVEAVGGLTYEILMPPFAVNKLSQKTGSTVSLHTYHYIESPAGGGTMFPRMVGFISREDKAFFEKLITVSTVGVKKALKAFTLSAPEFASAIERGDLKRLQTLPGIGRRLAEKIVAELKGKLGRFAIGVEGDMAGVPIPPEKMDIKNEAIEVLIQLQYKAVEAEDMIAKAYRVNPDISTVEELVQEVYKQRARR